MNFEPKIEPNSPSTDTIVLDADDVGADPVVVEEEETTLLHDLQGMTIHDLVQRVLLGACRAEIYDKVEGVLVTRDLDLKQQIQLLQHELQNEKISRLHVEEELNKRDQICQKWTKLQETHQALLKDSKKAQKDLLEANGNIDLLRKKNVKLMCEVNKLTREQVEAGKEFKVLSKMNEDLEGEINKLKDKMVEDGNVVQELEKLKEKRVEDGNALDVERRKNAELEQEVLKLKGKRVEDGNAIDMLKTKSDELECEVEKLKEKMVEDGNAFDVLKGKKCELESKVLELEKLKEKWLDDSNSLHDLRNKVGVLEDEKNALAGIEIKNGELKETVNTNLAIISKLRNENRKLVDEKRKGEILLDSLNTKFRALDERVARLEDDFDLSVSVDAYGGGSNEGDGEDVGGNEVGKNIEEKSAPLQRNEDGHQFHAGGSLNMQKDVEIINLDDEEDDLCMSQGEKNAISGICVKDEHPTPSSSIALQQETKFANVADTIKRKHFLPDNSETSISSSSVDSSYLDTIISVVSQPKKTKM